MAAPVKPRDETYGEQIELKKNNQNPKLRIVVERFHFKIKDCKQGERIVQYITELWKLTAYWDYGANLENMLHDRLVCGIQNERIQQRLLREGGSLTLKKAIDNELAKESVFENATITNITKTEGFERKLEPANNVQRKKERHKGTCYLCLGNHSASKCRFIEKKYFWC